MLNLIRFIFSSLFWHTPTEHNLDAVAEQITQKLSCWSTKQWAEHSLRPFFSIFESVRLLPADRVSDDDEAGSRPGSVG
jgi:hypothetical protein